MKIHRFYVPQQHLEHDFWFKDERLLHQWTKVLRFRVGQQVVLFNGEDTDRLFEVTEINATEAHVVSITDYNRNIPKKEIYLFWSILKKDKNDWVLQKCTELGVSHFIPLLTDRSDKTGFNIERAKKIIIEAAEQCGRSDIPGVRETMSLSSALQQYGQKIPLVVCEQGSGHTELQSNQIGVLIGPEGGWSEDEKNLFEQANIKYLSIHDFTLRAETASVAAVTMLWT